ncbi:hypothetical protein MA16_Dca001076 [Dendrobium catenatum]|uniref:Uncharacterized protein n=1 Tax=Dendrobium catenatum TaxID=906689 RepID=A0A2I0WLD7_9ASPA|nr:hypothetical protein MA16_Dca001076 [Dendrobium catenatum]
MFTDIRKSVKRPLWIGEVIWAELNAAWGSEEYSRKRDQNRQNRASDVGGLGSSLHTGGSVPHTEHRRRLVMNFKYFLNFSLIYINKILLIQTESHA